MPERGGSRGAIGRWADLLAAPILTVVAVGTVVGSSRVDPGLSIEHQLPTWAVALGLAGAASMTIAAWMVRGHRPAASLGLTIAGIALLLPACAGWPWLPAQIRAAAMSVAPAAIAGVAQVALPWRLDESRMRRVGIVGILAAAAAALLLAGYDPFEDPGCVRTCADIDPLAGDIVSTRTAALAAASLAICSAALGTISVVWSGRRTVPIAIVAAVAGALLLLGFGWAAWVFRWGRPELRDPVLDTVPGYAAAVLVGVATLIVAARLRSARNAMRRLVESLRDPGALVRDPRGTIREVQFPLDDGRWVDRGGRPIEGVAGTARWIVISDPAGPVVRLQVAEDADPSDVIASLTPATRLALRNEQLAVVGRARLDEVQASRRRIVSAADAERRRIERDLHDGAQQRLVSAAVHLSLARRRAPGAGPELAVAEDSVREALAQLRRIAHGPYPAILATEGLAAALEELVRSSDVPARLETRGELHVELETATAAYAAVATALDNATPGSSSAPARIEVARNAPMLLVRVTYGGAVPPDSTRLDLTDRVGAAGGEVRVTSTGDEVVLEAVLPCASS